VSLRLGVALVAVLLLVVGAADVSTLRQAQVSYHAQSLQSKLPPSPATDQSVIPQTVMRRGQPGYGLVPSSQFQPRSSTSAPFRGGETSKAPPTSAIKSSSSKPASPRIGIAPGIFGTGLGAAGLSITPPDSTGAIGPSHYVEMVNSRIAVYDRNLALVSSTTLWAFVGNTASVPYCDPQIQWDPAANRWLFSFLYCGGSATQGFVVGWSKTSDPSTLSPAGWCAFTRLSGSLLFDFMKLGHNSAYMILGGNYYANPTTSPSFASAAIAWLPLPPNGIQTCSPPQLFGTTNSPLKNGDGVSNTFTPVPVNTDSMATDGYILSAYDPSGSNAQLPGARSDVAVWHLDSAGVLHGDSDIAVNSYDTPTSAPQQAVSTVLDTLPGMLTQAVGDPVTGIYTQHTVDGPFSRSKADWYEFVMSGSKLVLAQQGSIIDPNGDWVFNAAISPRFDGLGATITYNRSSLNTAPLIGAQTRYQSTPAGQMAAGEVVMQGVGSATDFSCYAPYGPPCRWGDYSAATPDPVNTSLVWGTNITNVNWGSTVLWSSDNFAIAPTPEAPTSLHALARRSGGASVSWTPGAFDPLFPPTSYTVTADIGGPGGGVAQMTVAAPATSVTFTSLTPGVTYVFEMVANSAAGPSLRSVLSNPVTAGDPATQSTAAAPLARGVSQSAPTPPPGR